MRLSTYKELIRNLPCADQAFTTKRSTWVQRKYKNEQFNSYCRNVFKRGEVCLSRADVFNSCKEDFFSGVISIIFWGYPRNMRGNTFEKVLGSLQQNRIQHTLLGNKNLTEADYTNICKQLKGYGIGLSTLSKLLYFFEYSVDGYRCLILDKRIIEVLNEGTYEELNGLREINERNKNEKYVSYLKMMHEFSEAQSCNADQLEYFLFHFGRNLKGK